MRARIKKNDTVMVIAGRERGKTGKVLRVLIVESRPLSRDKRWRVEKLIERPQEA